jgi:hypothetical protein
MRIGAGVDDSGSSAAPKKYRLKHKSGGTRGIFNDKESAMKAHAAHPDKKNLMVEDFDETAKYNTKEHLMKSFSEFNQLQEELSIELEVGDFVVPKIGPHAGEIHYVSELLESGKVVIELSEGESSYADGVVSCSRFSLEKLDESLDEGWTKMSGSQEKRSIVRAGRTVNTPDGMGKVEYEHKTPTFSRDIPYLHFVSVKHDNGKKSYQRIANVKFVKESLDETSPFDWKGTKSSIDWKAAMKADKYAAPSHEDDGVTRHKQGDKPKVKPPKKSVGRPEGSYGSYKIDRGTRDAPDYKEALSAKVRAAKADGFAARNDFKKMMDDAIKKRQSELHNTK